MSLDTDITEVLEGEQCENCENYFTDEQEVRHINLTGICIACCEAEHE